MLPIFLIIESEEERKSAEAIYNLCSKTMYKVAYGIVNNSYDAEDAVMDALKRMILNIKKFYPLPDEEKMALAVIYVRHAAIDIYNGNAKRADKTPIVSISDTYVSEYSAFGDTDLRLLVDTIKGMPEEYSSPILLKYHFGFDNSEISKSLGIAESSVRSRISRGKAMLADILRKENLYEEELKV